MELGFLRDLIIVIWGFLALILIILTVILGFILYREFKKLTQNAKCALDTAKETSSDIGRAVKSLKSLVAAFRGKETGEKTSEL